MTDFTDADIDGDVSSMSGDEARQTLIEFMDVHATNRNAYDELQTEFNDTVAELEEENESLEARVSEFKSDLAAEAAEFVKLPQDLVADRFSIEEIEQIIAEGEEFADTDADDDSEDEQMTTFSEKDEKGKTAEPSSGAAGEKRQRAATLLSQNGFPAN